MMDKVKYTNIEKENKKLISEFEKYLNSKNLAPKTVQKHVDAAYFYIDVFLNDHYVVSAKEGINYTYIADYFDYFFIRKCMWSTPETLRSEVASIKKFYAFMYEKGLVSDEDFDEFRYMIKESIDDWCEDCQIYNDGGEYIPI